MDGCPPMALRTLAALVMCSISSITTLRIVLASKLLWFTIEYIVVRYSGMVLCSTRRHVCSSDCTYSFVGNSSSSIRPHSTVGVGRKCSPPKHTWRGTLSGHGWRTGSISPIEGAISSTAPSKVAPTRTRIPRLGAGRGGGSGCRFPFSLQLSVQGQGRDTHKQYSCSFVDLGLIPVTTCRLVRYSKLQVHPSNFYV
jgi:hypothetical protein